MLRNPAFFPVVNNRSVAALLIAVDVVMAYVLYSAGFSMAAAHIGSFFISFSLPLSSYVFGAGQEGAGKPGGLLRRFISVLGFIILQLSIRGGAIASLAEFGLSDVPSLLAGIIVSTLLAAYSSGLILRRDVANVSGWIVLTVVLVACVLILRLVYLGGMEVLPQEAYYWNYAKHLSPGYLDHPPMVALLIWSGELLFGHGPFGTRFFSYLSGLLFIYIFYRFSRLQVDRQSALLSVVFALVLPYYFFASGFFMTPDTPLTVAWAAALYFFYRALVLEENGAWYGVGVAMGLGMLSKYTIVLLAPAALLFVVLDPRSRALFLKKEPYLAVLIAFILFTPVLYWNVLNDWASFAFHSGQRFEESQPQFSLHLLLQSIVAMVTPLPLLALPYLFMRRVSRDGETDLPINLRGRLFIKCFLLVPLLVFAISALENEPRYNWTGPLWIPLLPLLGWLLTNAPLLRWRPIGALIQYISVPLLFFLLCLYAVALHFISLGLPGVEYPRGMGRLVGWENAVEQVQEIRKQVRQQLPDDGRVIVAGLDKYFISSKLAYYGDESYLGNEALDVAGYHIIGGNSLMFEYWNPADELDGAAVILIGYSEHDLFDFRTVPFFDELSPDIKPFPIIVDDFNRASQKVRQYHYRVGFGYKPSGS